MDNTVVLCDNIMDLDLDTIRISLFSMLESHRGVRLPDSEQMYALMDTYSEIFVYASELYVHCIALVRHYAEAKDIRNKTQAMDRRDMIEQFLKATKFYYDTLSRKVTIYNDTLEETKHA